jgi:hypothetical protein
VGRAGAYSGAALGLLTYEARIRRTDETRGGRFVLDADFSRRRMVTAAATVDLEAAHLTELDSAIGDADHGTNLQRGFTAVTAALEEDAGTPDAVLVRPGGS